MKMKRLASLALSAIMSVSLLAGCGSSTAPSTSSSAAPASSAPAETAQTKPSGTIKVSAWDLTTQLAYVQKLADAFMAKNPDIKVEIVDIPSADYTTKLSVMLNGGTDVDAFLIKDADTALSLYKKGQLADLSSYIQKDSIDLSIYNGLADYYKFDSQQNAIPFRTDYYVLYYNKDIFDAAKVAYPTNDMTWSEFEELSKKVTSGNGADKIHGAFLHTWQACVENWAVQDGKNTIMGPDYSFMKPYYEMALRMQNDDKTIPDYATLKTANIHYSSAFQTGTCAMLPMGSWFMSTMIDVVAKGESKVNWGIATLPHPDGIEAGNTVGSTTPIAINAKSKNQAAAWEFVKFCTSTEGAQILAESGQFPGCVNDEFLKTITSIDGMPEGASDALKVKGIVLDRPIIEHVSEVNQMLGEEHSLIMLGEVSIDDGVAAMAERSKEISSK